MPAIAEFRIPIMLDKERNLIFNFNTMSAYEEITRRDGEPKFYFDTIMTLYEHLADDSNGGDNANKRVLSAARRMPISDLRNLVWAATHHYDAQGEMVHPLTRSQIGRYLGLLDAPKMLSLIVQGHTANSPSKQEVGEAGGVEKAPNPPSVQAEPTPPENGGGASTGLQQADFA